MQNDAAQYLDFIDGEDLRQQRAKRSLIGLILVLVSGLFWSISNDFEAIPVAAAGAVFLVAVSMIIGASNRKAQLREEAFLRFLEVNLDLFEDNSYRERLILAAQTGTFDELQVRKNTGSVRGQDEKGFTGGRKVEPLNTEAKRIDPGQSDEGYDGLEGELRRSEHLLSEANARYEAKANEQWQASESSDVDLIEAGVERLGDLVRTDWFEKNAMDGAVDELMGQGQKE